MSRTAHARKPRAEAQVRDLVAELAKAEAEVERLKQLVACAAWCIGGMVIDPSAIPDDGETDWNAAWDQFENYVESVQALLPETPAQPDLLPVTLTPETR